MSKEFQQNDWTPQLAAELQRLLALAVFEDSEDVGDLTSRALIPETAEGSASIRARKTGVVAGVQAVQTILDAVDTRLRWEPDISDGAALAPGTAVGTIRGPARSLLTAERLVLNLVGRLSGIASLTKKYVDTLAGTPALLYDTRKTTLGWRRLEKYAVLCGGGRNHRTGLFDAVLIKDNHLAFGREGGGVYTPAEAVLRAKEFLASLSKAEAIVEIEVDTLSQLEEVLPAGPDIVLLDNMVPATLAEAVAMRNRLNPTVELEASGGVNLSTIRPIAETGVERISVGALTHSAISLDLGLDWNELRVKS